MFSLLPVYSARKSSNHKLSHNHKISPDPNIQKTYTNIKHKIFEELVPSVLPLLTKHIKLEHAGIVDHSVDLSMPDFFFFFKLKKGVDRRNKNMRKKCIKANTSAIWQHAALTADQLTSLSCQRGAIQKAYLLFFFIFGGKKDRRKSNRTRQKNRRGDNKVESNDSPEIPDRGETSDIPGLHSGRKKESERETEVRVSEECLRRLWI